MGGIYNKRATPDLRKDIRERARALKDEWRAERLEWIDRTLRMLLFVNAGEAALTARLKNFQNLAGRKPLGPLRLPRGEEAFFCRMQGRTRAPGRCRFHLPVGQPLASECRSVADRVPFLDVMRCGHPRHVSRPRLAARAYLDMRPPDLPGIARGPAWKAA